MRSKNLEFEETDEQYQESSVWGKRFASAGGVANAVIECMKERGEDTQIYVCVRQPVYSNAVRHWHFLKPENSLKTLSKVWHALTVV